MALVLDGTNGVSGVDGTASNPSLEGTDSNTGVFFPAADTVAIGTGGTERLRVDSAGNGGLGVTPAAWASGVKALQVGANSYASTVDLNNGVTVWGSNYYNDGGNKFANASSRYALQILQDTTNGAQSWRVSNAAGTAGNAITFTTAMTLNASGNLGVGETSIASDTRLHLKHTTDNCIAKIQSTFGAELQLINGGGSELSVINATGNNVLVFRTGNTERARITSGGFFKAQGNSTYLGAAVDYHEFMTAVNNNQTAHFKHNGSSGTQYGIYIETANDQNDTTRWFWQCNGATTQRATLRSNGGLANYSANNVNLASDERLKKDVSLLATTWDKVKQIEVVNFRYKDCNEGDPLLYGVIAQQVQPIVPELVVVTQEAKEATEDAEATPEYYGIREQPMYWLAIKALQEAMTRIEQLEAKVAALENA